jgi:tRNA A37 N6-isopentenylltransferase MiaA
VADALAETIRRTWAYARRQLRWFRRDPRIRWDDGEDGGRAAGVLGEWISCT